VRVVLQVGVHRDHDAAGRRLEPGRERRGLAEVAAELDGGDVARVAELVDDVLDLLPGPVRAAVVDEDDLVAQVGPLGHRVSDLVDERRDRRRFVARRDHDGHVDVPSTGRRHLSGTPVFRRMR
jgi:hypothetical protein